MSTSSGLWLGPSEGYMGVRFDSSGTTYYGWVRMAINSTNETLTFLDYAYQSNGGPIDAGEMPVIPCLAPSSLMSSSITTNSADLSWTENNSATQWQIEYGTTGFTQGGGTPIITSSNPNTISGLTDNTTYDYYVRSICGVGDTSDWTGPENFETLIDDAGIHNTSNDHLINIYPNPSNGQFNLNIDSDIHDAAITIYNLLGEEVYKSTNISKGNNAINLIFPTSGTYVYQITSNQINTTGKISINK